jgi:hypothetical protein
MLRAIGIFGLGILFLVISPPLRASLIEQFTKLQTTMIENAPWSYLEAGVVLLVALMIWIRRANQPKI